MKSFELYFDFLSYIFLPIAIAFLVISNIYCFKGGLVDRKQFQCNVSIKEA